MRLSDTAWGAIFLALSVALVASGFHYAAGQVGGGGTFPIVIGCGLLACSVRLILRGTRQGEALFRLADWARSGRHVGNFLAVAGCLAVFAASANALGYHLALAIALFFVLIQLGNTLRVSVIMAMATAAVLHLLFYKGLRVPLPWGVLPVLY